jgi:hypothetical protein
MTYLVTFHGKTEKEYKTLTGAYKACENFFQNQARMSIVEVGQELEDKGWCKLFHGMTDDLECFIETI